MIRTIIKTGWILTTIFIACMFVLTSCMSITHSSSQTTLTGSVNAAISKSAYGLSLTLSLDSTTYQLYQDVLIVIDERNTLLKTNNIPVSNKWLSNELELGPRDKSFPFGIAVFQGYYTSSDFSTTTPLNYYDPNGMHNWPLEVFPNAYSFQPLSNIANIIVDSDPNLSIKNQLMSSVITLTGYWIKNDSNDVYYQFNSFSPGVYTVVVGDEWGALVVLHFTIAE